MFKLDLTGTTPGRGIRADANTFATMAYIAAVNPLILADDSEATGCASTLESRENSER